MIEATLLSSMDVSQVHATLRAPNIDFWSKAAEHELVATYERCLGHKSSLFRLVHSAWFLFSFSFLLLYLWWLGHPGRVKGAVIALLLGLAACVLAGLLRLAVDWISEVSGLDRAAWAARQLQPLRLHAPAFARANQLADTHAECMAYQRQLTLRGRSLRLVDLGAMVYLSNKTRAARQV